jgi:hypothetical protein
MKKPIELYMKLDAYLIARLNELYLWALDWTGIYVGTLVFLSMVPSIANLIARDHMWAGAIVLFCGILMGAPRYWLQGFSTDAFNKIALQLESQWPRHVFVWWNISELLLDFIIPEFRTLLYVASDAGWLLLWYLIVLKIRERDPKHFTIWKLAHGTNA